MKPYLKDPDQVLTELHSERGGLSVQEAQRRLDRHGPNLLTEQSPPSLLRRFFRQMADPMILILLASAAVSAAVAVYETKHFTDSLIILCVVLLNSILGLVQESKAEHAISALRSMTAPTAKVLRSNELVLAPTYTLVPGDIVRLEAGDAVPADCRILESASLQAEESALTGESLPVEKQSAPLCGTPALGDRTNMVYMGSNVVYGRCTAVVCNTGMDTEMGRIAHALNRTDQEQTPLQKKLAALSHTLTWLVLGICAAMLGIGIWRAGGFSPQTAMDSFMTAVSLAVAAIPEGLTAVVTVVLSIGVTGMSRRGAVIRRLTAVETLGCAQVICSDKTGTLTQNRMTVTQVSAADTTLLTKAMALCSDAQANDDGSITGEPTECALVHYAVSAGLKQDDLQQAFPRVGELPFDSDRKLMTTLHTVGDAVVQYTKGAPDVVLSRCSKLLTEDGEVPLTDVERIRISVENKAMADNALRVLACGYRRHESLPQDCTSDSLELDMVFIGLVGMMDPIRPEAKVAVSRCRQAGIRPIMITGDHVHTAAAIGRELGLLTDDGQALVGSSLDDWSDDALDAVIDRYTVYARVRPEHKVRIVESWKRKGAVTAMTGDGVNDAPALKAADIGVGMGITGTDVTKNVADMVLTDDNFSTIVDAVEEGRRIYANIRKAIRFLLSSNLSEVICVFTATLLGFTILKSPQILWINLITDSIPALALGMEAAEAHSMHHPPRNPRAGIFADGLGFDVLYQGILVALLTLAAYFTGLYLETGSLIPANSLRGTTMAFVTLSLTEIFHSFNMRAARGSIFTLPHRNKWLYRGGALALLLTVLITAVPFLADAFALTPPNLRDYAISAVLAALIIPLVELMKLLQRRKEKSLP